eukprot:110733_1
MTSHTETQFNFINQVNTTFNNIDKLINQLNVEIESDKYFSKEKNLNIVKSTDYSCMQCNNQVAISWSQCKHRYCSECISQIINEHLTLRNEIPKCPECLVTINIQKISQRKFKSSYPEKYKLKITFKEYTNMEKLIHGYIRKQHYIIPNSLTLLIFDFYYLNYVKPVKCDKCISLKRPISAYDIAACACCPYPPFAPFIEHMTLYEATKLNVNDEIDHRDHVGRFITATIIQKQGTNLKIHYNGWSSKWDVWSDFTVELYRFAKYKSISNRPAHRLLSLEKGSYIDINPRRRYYGWRYTEIRRFDIKSGQVQVVYNIDNIDNKSYLYWMHLDNQSEIAPFTTMCKNDISIQKDCDKCVLVLDFNKLCHKQKVCIKCNEFHPLDCVIFWPKCKHVLCITCLMKYAKDSLMQNKIPVCPVVDCHNDIAQTEHEMNGHNITFLYNSLQTQDTIDLSQYMLYNRRLKLLLYRKDRFECSICNKWHKNDDMFIKKNTKNTKNKRLFYYKPCQHKYGNKCYRYLMHSTNCGHSDCLQCLAKCEICQTFDENKYLIVWTKCGHKYHKHCAQKYINEWISKQQSILNILSNQYVSNNNMIPLCIDKNCDEFLDVHYAELLGATQYQCTILYELRKKSILIDSKDIEIRLREYEPGFSDFDLSESS